MLTVSPGIFLISYFLTYRASFCFNDAVTIFKEDTVLTFLLYNITRNTYLNAGSVFEGMKKEEKIM